MANKMTFKEILHNTLSIQSKSGMTSMMNHYILRFTKKIPGATAVFKDGNIYIRKGESKVYPTIVAHTDTVHSIEDSFVVLKHDGVYFGWNGVKQVGVGGDDKVGIAIALWFLQEKESIKVAFFRDEEIGCKGSALADMTFFEDSSFVIQCDRQGSRDMVSSIMGQTLFDAEFKAAVKPYVEVYKRDIVTGAMTDVWKLRTKGLKVASTNLSTGYYAPHSDREIVIEIAVEDTVDFVDEIITNLGYEKQWIVSKAAHKVAKSGVWTNALVQARFYEPDFNEYEGLCPECGNDSVLWEEDVEQFYCYTCASYVDDSFFDITGTGGN